MADKTFISGNFFKNAVEMRQGPKWGMSLKAASSMRFRWNEKNPAREIFLKNIRGSRELCQVELIHSHKVMAVDSSRELYGVQADGIITQNKNLFPVVTVADCMPIFIYEEKTGVFGILHSGWKGTGIVEDALLLAKEKYGSRPKDFSVVMGPHIHECCYNIDEERAEYFRKNFSSKCVKVGLKNQINFKNEASALNGIDTLKSCKIEDEKFSNLAYSLSLAEANLFVLKKLGLNEDSIAISKDCTCCNPLFGSFRRQNASEGTFTVQAAWVMWDF